MRKTAKDLLAEFSDLNKNDLRTLLCAAKQDIQKNDVVFDPENVIFSGEETSFFYALVRRYQSHEPVSKIINKKSFWDHEFFVNSDVLDPRPETELIVEFVLKKFPKNAAKEFLDIGTGSGCILLSILSALKNSHGIGIDISAGAIAVANKNKSLLNVQNADFVCVNWNEISFATKFDVIVSNPPYIKTADIESLDENVKHFDPFISLNGGDDGLNAYRDISRLSEQMLKDDGMILLEVGFDQAKSVSEILMQHQFRIAEIIKDLAEIDRVVVAQKLTSSQ